MNGTAPEFVDFHCHLDLYPDFEALVAECEAQRIFTLGVTTTPAAWPRNHALTSSTRFVRSALGLHPQLVASRANEVDLWDQYLSQSRYVGEVGLDFGPQFFRSAKTQKEVFEHVLRRCAQVGNKVLTVHSVRSASSVLDMIESHLANTDNRVVMHWFTGTAREAARAVHLGCYFSINAPMVAKPQRRVVVASLPLDRVLTETDGPFTKAGLTPARPTDVATAVDTLGEIFKMDRGAMAYTIRQNLRDLVST
jgi:TatD DNase family protein